MLTFSRLIHLLLVSALLLTSQGMAVVRGASGPAGQMVLCVGTQTVVVDVDQQGQPVERTHLCPDCALSILDHVNLAAAVANSTCPQPTVLAVRAELAHPGTRVPPRMARGPPALG
ncbi:MAG: hypothetical protein AB8B51_08755 [Sedimentitalea sp.]